MAEPERDALIRILIDHLIPVAGFNERTSLEDTAVATEITAFTREDEVYNLEGALLLTGVLREEATLSEEELFAALQGDVLTSAPAEEEERESVVSFHYRLPFHLCVPVEGQESGLLNVFARIGQWDLRFVQADRAQLLGELIIYGLNGKDGYVFRCGEEEGKESAERVSFARENPAGQEPEPAKLAPAPAESSFPWMGKEASPAGKTVANGKREEKIRDDTAVQQPDVQEAEGYDEEEWSLGGEDSQGEEVHFIPDQDWVSRLNSQEAQVSAKGDGPSAEEPSSSEPEPLAAEEPADVSLEEKDRAREQETTEPFAEILPYEDEPSAVSAQAVAQAAGDETLPVLPQEENGAGLEAEHELAQEEEEEEKEDKEATVSIGGKKKEVWLGWKFKEDHKFTFKFRIVQESDQLERLAETYSCSVSEIMRANGMTHEQIDSGQVLYIPTKRQ